MMHSVLIFLVALIFPALAFAQDTTRLKLLFVGDIMQHDSNIAASYNALTGKYDYSACFGYVSPIIKSADVAIGNLELTLAGSPYKGYPQFSAPDELAYELKRIGFDVLVTANNHSVDRGRKGIERTLDVLDTLALLHTGTFKDSMTRANAYPLLIEKNGFRISLLNCTYGTNGIPVPRPTIVNLIDTVKMKADLEKAKAQHSDAIIVFMHWGDEYQSLPNKFQKRIADLCFREGAKLVIGSHPHVLQPIEWRKESDQLVAWSLGNFISGQRPRYRDGGAMLWVDLQKIKTDSLSSTSVHQAEYELEWVQKSNRGKKGFVMFPFRYFETDTSFIEDKMLRGAFEVFKTDARTLYSKHNLGVTERAAAANLDSLQYAVCLGSFSDEQANALIDNDVLQGYGLERTNHGEGHWLWYAGKFSDKTKAQEALLDMETRTGILQMRVVKRMNENGN